MRCKASTGVGVEGGDWLEQLCCDWLASPGRYPSSFIPVEPGVMVFEWRVSGLFWIRFSPETTVSFKIQPVLQPVESSLSV